MEDPFDAKIVDFDRSHQMWSFLRDRYEPTDSASYCWIVTLCDCFGCSIFALTTGCSSTVFALVSACASPFACGGGGGGLHCDYCGKDGHVEAFCYRKKKVQRSQASQASHTSQASGSASTGVSQRSCTDPATQEMLMLLRRLAASSPSRAASAVTLPSGSPECVAERKHRHLLETARAFMFASSVPPHFWVEAVSTATYLINIRPSSALRGGIPLGPLCGKTPDYSDFRIFGCVCYVVLAPRERTKLTAHAEHKGYHCWDPVGRRMRISRDVVFDESRPFYPRVVPPSVVPSGSSSLTPDYTKPPVTQLAMAEEIAAFECMSTWDLVPTPSHVHPKWVYKVKTHSDGSLERYKACLEHGRDYDETFALVAHMTTVRALLAVASLDVKNAFLNGELREEVYMQPLPGYSVFEEGSSGLVLALCFCGHDCWFFCHTPLFVHTSSRGRILLLYVDDMIITGDDPQFIAFVKARLSEQFFMSDLGSLRYFLGLRFPLYKGFYLSEEKYIQGLLNCASITDHRTNGTPMELDVHLSATDGEPLDDPTRYRHIVGSLVYLGVTRSDISYSVYILSQFVSAPTQLHYSHLLRDYCDAIWASDSSDHRSLFAYCVFLGGSLIAWKTKKQIAVSRSSTEIELRAMALVRAEVTWLRWLLEDFGVSVSISTPFLTDSTCAICIARDPVKHELTKHIGVDAYYTRAQVQDGVVTLRYVPSELHLADFFTKAQTRAQHRELRVISLR
ncbi:hypothetical protein U9M48_035510 [Paspalum notatum var. saurae]|uniref:Reverse transcriptase Ty1/copia-type domain-containing protein n=1 Tax=Paspalum notatum var. saurae TaxID=547442 RepID=A0AAQ3X937_PASNO